MVTQNLKHRLVYSHNGTSSSVTSSLPPECALIVLASTLATPSTFILNHYLRETLKTNSNNGAVFLSFHYDFVRQALQLNKLGTNLAHAQEQGRYKFIDGFHRLFMNTSAPQPSNGTYLSMSSVWGINLAQVIMKALGEMKTEKPALFIDGLDFLLATSEEHLSTNELLALLSNLSEVTSRMYIAVSADHALLQSTPPTTLTENQSVLVTSLIHRAYSVISLRPLQTGTAKDVTGVMRVTRGGAWYDFMSGNRDATESGEWEMLYHLDDGRAKLFKHA